jgi:hypothetical protein
MAFEKQFAERLRKRHATKAEPLHGHGFDVRLRHRVSHDHEIGR